MPLWPSSRVYKTRIGTNYYTGSGSQFDRLKNPKLIKNLVHVSYGMLYTMYSAAFRC